MFHDLPLLEAIGDNWCVIYPNASILGAGCGFILVQYNDDRI
jgi:hypothetical protein